MRRKGKKERKEEVIQGIMAYTNYSGTRVAEAGRVQGQPGKHGKIHSQTKS